MWGQVVQQKTAWTICQSMWHLWLQSYNGEGRTPGTSAWPYSYHSANGPHSSLLSKFSEQHKLLKPVSQAQMLGANFWIYQSNGQLIFVLQDMARVHKRQSLDANHKEQITHYRKVIKKKKANSFSTGTHATSTLPDRMCVFMWPIWNIPFSYANPKYWTPATSKASEKTEQLGFSLWDKGKARQGKARQGRAGQGKATNLCTCGPKLAATLPLF
jgi:hypothetical protein